jgi:hypothetical protein
MESFKGRQIGKVYRRYVMVSSSHDTSLVIGIRTCGSVLTDPYLENEIR